MSAEEIITFDDAVNILRTEINFPSERALHYIQKFDKNKDGKLQLSEFKEFKDALANTKKILLPKFQEFDKDGNGYITLDEARDILQAPPFKFPAETVVTLLMKFDKDGNGKLDIEEFADFYAESSAINEELQQRFDAMDADHNGLLSFSEVTNTIKEIMGFDDDASAKVLVDMFDVNKDGNLDKTEFIEMWTNVFGAK